MSDPASEREQRDYPILRELLTDHHRYTALREKCLGTCRRLDDLVRTGSPEQRDDAQRTLDAYGHALRFLEEAIRARDRVLEENRGERP